MHRFFLLFSLLALNLSAYAAPSAVWWPQWKVASCEQLWLGRKYSSYPIPLMLDGDAKTAWVYSATREIERDRFPFSTKYGFELKPTNPVTIDSLRIMNGHNRSRQRFQANHRLVRIRVHQAKMDGTSAVTEKALADTMGWQIVRLPRHKIKSLRIEFPKVKKSTARNADVCISELVLMNGNTKLDWRLPRATMSHLGFEGCDALYFITRTGRQLKEIPTEQGYRDVWSPNGRYVCGLNYGDVAGSSDTLRVWIADTWRGKVIREFKIQGYAADYKWRDARTLSVSYKQNGKTQTRYFKAPTFR